MYLVDTCGWVEWLTEGQLIKKFEKYLETPEQLIIPTIIQFELFKWICREFNESLALTVMGTTERGEVVPLDTHIAISAARAAKRHNLAMADATIYATAQTHAVTLITCDSHFKDLPNVEFFPKK